MPGDQRAAPRSGRVCALGHALHRVSVHPRRRFRLAASRRRRRSGRGWRPEPLNGGGVGAEPVAVAWEVADDEAFGRIVAARHVRWRAGVGAHRARGGDRARARALVLLPVHGGRRGEPGRPHRAPRPAAEAPPSSCGSRSGRASTSSRAIYAAHRHLADEDLDLMVFVGDYIYEGRRAPARCAATSGGEARTLARLPQPPRAVQDRSDLQALHAAVPWLVTWDDHEVDNDYAGDCVGGARPGVPRAAAPRPTGPTSSTCRCAGALARRATAMVLRSRRDWGRARAPPPARRPPAPHAAGVPAARARRRGADRRALPRAVMRPGGRCSARRRSAGSTEGLAARPSRWNFIAQQTLMARARDHASVGGRACPRTPGTATRAPATACSRRSPTPGCAAASSLSGDAHTAFVCDLKLRLRRRRRRPSSRPSSAARRSPRAGARRAHRR